MDVLENEYEIENHDEYYVNPWVRLIFEIECTLYTDDLGELAGAGMLGNIPEKAREAFDYLVNSFDGFLHFETAFYHLVVRAYYCEREVASDETLITLDCAKNVLSKEQYSYINVIYQILQHGFSMWLQSKGKRDGQSFPIELTTYWTEVYELASQAHNLYPEGEVAVRMMFIADLMLMFGCGKSADSDKVINIKKLEKYLDIRSDIFELCSDYVVRRNDDQPIMDMPYINFSSDSKADNPYTFETLLMRPASIYNAQTYVYENYHSPFLDMLKAKTEHYRELERANAELRKARDEKRDLIDSFAHTYGNMCESELKIIGDKLMEIEDDEAQEYGKKILIEFWNQQTQAKQVKILQLKNNDDVPRLLQKLRGDTSVSYDKTVSDLVSDALQRNFMALLYCDAEEDYRKWSLYWKIQENKEKQGTPEQQKRKEELKKSFENSCFKENNSALDWVKELEGFNFALEVSGIWRELHFLENGYSAVMLTDWISELIKNAMRYADKSQIIKLRFFDDGKLLFIEISNKIDPSTNGHHGSECGVSSILKDVHRLNEAVHCLETYAFLKGDSSNYCLQIGLSPSLFMNE